MKTKGEAILELIRQEFADKKLRNPRYSIRAFARLLGISSSTLSQIMSGKRRLTFQSARAILASLGVDEAKRNALLLTFDNPQNFVPAPQKYQVLTEAQLQMIADWQFYAVLCALEVCRKANAETIAKKINCDVPTVTACLDILIEQGLVRREGNKLLVTGERLTTSHQAGSAALVKAHKNHILKSLDVLDRFPKECDFSGITEAVSSEKLPEVIRRIRDFRRSLMAYFSEGDKDAIYRINIQLFPLK